MAPGGHDPIPYDFWFNNDPPPAVICECLMPTGHVIDIEVPHSSTFQEIKEVSVTIKFDKFSSILR